MADEDNTVLVETVDTNLNALIAWLRDNFKGNQSVKATLRESGQPGSPLLTLGFYAGGDELPVGVPTFGPRPTKKATVKVGAPDSAETDAVSASPISGVQAKNMGFTGDTCIRCGSFEVVRNGTCSVCKRCGETTGCS